MGQPEREQHRETSIAAYHKIRDGGLLTEARMGVYAAVFHLGSPTSHEIDKYLCDRRLQHTRLTELRDMGAIEEGPVRECTVTGQNVLTWVVTGQLPKGLPKRPKQPSWESLSWMIDCLSAQGMYDTELDVMRDKDGIIEWLLYRRNMSK